MTATTAATTAATTNAAQDYLSLADILGGVAQPTPEMAAWAAEALTHGSAESGEWWIEEATSAQCARMFAIGSARRNGMLPVATRHPGVVAWVHAEWVAAWQVCLPSVYFRRRAADGVYEYESCTGNTKATVYRDGRVGGETISAIGRYAARADQPWQKCHGVPPEVGPCTSATALEAALAAFAALERRLLTATDWEPVEARVRAVAAFAVAMGHDPRIPLPQDWDGDLPPILWTA